MFFGSSANRITSVPVESIRPNPHQPRRVFLEEELRALAGRIRENGIIQPLVVRKRSNGYFELIAGERRLRACALAGLQEAPCIVMEADDKQSAILALMENLQRQDLNFFEEAEGILILIRDFGLTQEEAAVKLGKKQSTVANKLRLLRMSSEERQIILANGLTERHARAVLKLEEPKRLAVLQQIARQGLNVAQTERLVESLLQKPEEKRAGNSKIIVKDVRIFLNTVAHAIETMRQSGIAAEAEQVITDDYIEYTVRIPKNGSASKQTA